MRTDDRGSVTLWMLGLSMMLLLFGGLAIDFWRALALQRELAAVADSTAIAAASGIDEEVYRSSGHIVLSPRRANALAMASIDFQSARLDEALVVLDPSGTTVEVEVVASLKLGLLGVLVDDSEPIQIRAAAAASPVLSP